MGKRKVKESAVRRVSRIFGGGAALGREIAVELGLPRPLSRSTVCHWDRPPGDNGVGRGGSIPDKYHRPILAAARRLRLSLSPADLVNV